MSAASTAALRRPALGRPARAGRCLRARSGRDFFGKDGMRAQSGSRDLSQLLGGGGGGAGGGGGLDLGQGVDLGPAAEPSGEDPLNYDPEGLFKNATTMQDGHIARRAVTRGAQTQEEMDRALAKQQERADAEAEERRAATELPERAEALVDFFLECEAADMEFWVARARARLGAPFFAAVDTALGEARLLGEGGEERVAELEGLRAYVNQTLAAQDSVKKGVEHATARLKRLLTASDKKQTILDMAAANELDAALLQLLQQNIEGASRAGNADAAAFMSKVRDACAKWVITKDRSGADERAAAEAAATGSGLASETRTAGEQGSGLIVP